MTIATSILARVASISFIAALPDAERGEVLREVARILDAHQVGIAGAPRPDTASHRACLDAASV